jgi:hypothetical protein
LENILQVAMDLPAVPDQVLIGQITLAIDAALAWVDNAGPFDKGVWPDVFMEVIRPLIRNMRDVRRYALAIHGTLRGLDGQIALPDVLALEAIRLFLPDVFASLHGKVDALTKTSTVGPDDRPKLKLQIDGLIKDAGVQGNVVRGMIERLFPAALRHIGGSHYQSDWKGRWLTGRRRPERFADD